MSATKSLRVGSYDPRWLFGEDGKAVCSFLDEEGDTINNFEEYSALIVRAVNSHEALVAEVEKDIHWIENLLGDINAGRGLRAERISEGLTIRWNALRAVVAQAKGQP